MPALRCLSFVQWSGHTAYAHSLRVHQVNSRSIQSLQIREGPYKPRSQPTAPPAASSPADGTPGHSEAEDRSDDVALRGTH